MVDPEAALALEWAGETINRLFTGWMYWHVKVAPCGSVLHFVMEDGDRLCEIAPYPLYHGMTGIVVARPTKHDITARPGDLFKYDAFAETIQELTGEVPPGQVDSYTLRWLCSMRWRRTEGAAPHVFSVYIHEDYHKYALWWGEDHRFSIP